jgi:hypothetical protein
MKQNYSEPPITEAALNEEINLWGLVREVQMRLYEFSLPDCSDVSALFPSVSHTYCNECRRLRQRPLHVHAIQPTNTQAIAYFQVQLCGLALQTNTRACSLGNAMELVINKSYTIHIFM